MRITLKIFALLDLVSLVFIAMQLQAWYTTRDAFPTNAESMIRAFATILIFVSLFITIWGHFKATKLSLITYYIQFPIRLMLWIFTLGFITLLPEAFSRYEDYWFDWLFRICVLGEFFRLYFTIVFHRRLLRQSH